MERQGNAIWPGTNGVCSCSYTASHGIHPAIATLQLLPGSEFASQGDLIITDGFGTIPIRDCKVDKVRTVLQDDGFSYVLDIADHRWRWRDTGQISGAYNLLDDHGKLIGWSIRSPLELAQLCLKEMGETNASIDMPAGLDSNTVKNWLGIEPPWIGVPATTGTNPEIHWDAENPALALANLCEQFGRRVIWQTLSNRVLITRLGIGVKFGSGDDFPDGSIASISPGIEKPDIPDGIGIVGGETRYQSRFLLEPVGREADGSWRNINALSYAPVVTECIQITDVSVGYDTKSVGIVYKIYVDSLDRNNPLLGRLFSYTSLGSESEADVATALTALINASIAAQDFLTASASGSVITMNSNKGPLGRKFSVAVANDFSALGANNPNDPRNYIKRKTIQYAKSKDTPWDFSANGGFANVINGTEGGGTPDNRLTYDEALALAQETVYRAYRLIPIMPDGSTPFRVPGYPNEIRRIQQILLTSTKVEQITPQPQDAQLLGRDNRPLVINFYNGYSRDKPAAVYGSIFQTTERGRRWWKGLENRNTNPGDLVLTHFRVVPEYQIIIFDEPVYFSNGEATETPDIVLETGVFIRNPDTNQVECATYSRNLPGRSGSKRIAWRKRRDVQFNTIAKYNPNDSDQNITMDAASTGVTLLELDPVARAKFYLDGLALQFITAASGTNKYNGIIEAELDGALTQITWEFGEGGISTTISRNTEHSLYIPPYPVRRRNEFLSPAELINNPQRLSANRFLQDLP